MVNGYEMASVQGTNVVLDGREQKIKDVLRSTKRFAPCVRRYSTTLTAQCERLRVRPPRKLVRPAKLRIHARRACSRPMRT